MTVNKVILVGNLGRDPEVRTTQSGTSVANMRIATSSRRKDRDGNWQDETEWHSVVAFGKTAESAGRFLKKGRQVYIEGRLQTRKWQDKEGRDRWSTEVVCDVLRFLGRKDDGGGSVSGGGYSGGGSGGSGGYSGGADGGGGGGAFGDDDIPFGQADYP